MWRTEIIHEAHPSAGDDGNGQAIRVGDYKLILEKGPMTQHIEGLEQHVHKMYEELVKEHSKKEKIVDG